MTSNPITKEIVCLANSRKPPSGRCVAGREITSVGFGPWIRAVSDRPTHEISLEERRYRDGTDPAVLDIISITMKGPQPHLHQQENHLIDADCYWTRQGRISWQHLQTAVEDPAGPLWLNAGSSYNGHYDRVSEDVLGAFHRSLWLVRPRQLTLLVASERGELGPPRRRVRARFELSGIWYCMVVTDPWTESSFLAGNDGAYDLPDALLCISLGEIFHGYAYKLAATVITPDRAGA